MKDDMKEMVIQKKIFFSFASIVNVKKNSNASANHKHISSEIILYRELTEKIVKFNFHRIDHN